MSADSIEMTGIVTRVHKGDIHEIDCVIGETHCTVLARRSGRLYAHRIRIVPGDRVRVEVSPFDPRRGRITYRLA